MRMRWRQLTALASAQVAVGGYVTIVVSSQCGHLLRLFCVISLQRHSVPASQSY